MNEFPSYPLRKQKLLDGIWDFCWLGNTVTLKDFTPDQAHFTGDKAAVPGVFDMGIDHYCERGLGVYRTAVDHFEAEKLRLHVAGMGLGARIFWDGREVGFYPYAYTAMDFDFASDGRFHELIIAVDNRFDCVPVPQFYDYYDFYAYGGIYRSLKLYALPEKHLDRAQVYTEDIATGLVRIKLQTGGFADGETLDLELAFDTGAYAKHTVTLSEGVAELKLNVPEFRLWTPDAPNLHKLYVRAGNDEIVERFGIRTVRTQGQKILLNGKEIYLKGANLHETHPQFGPVQSTAAMLDDIRLLKDMGGNFLRLVHYPHDEAFLDLCDEAGIMVWQESLGWGLAWNRTEKLFMPGRKECLLEQNRLMVASGVNHPSVLIWGFLNECASSDDRAPELYQLLADSIRAQDPSRLVSWASDKKMADKCFAAADVISINGYPGWFEDISDSTTFAWEYMPAYFKRHAEYFSKEEFAGKPLFMSEIGACGMYGVHDRNFAQWTEEFQSEYMENAARNILENKRFCGFTLWQFIDSRSYGMGEIRGKPRGYNLAGLVDEYRRPKMAFYAIRKLFRGE